MVSVKVGERYRPLRDEVLDELRDQILTGRLAPGSMLNESALAAELGVSRLPVREAIRQLESMGLVASVPRKGVRIVAPDPEEAEMVHQIRVVLEILAVRRTIERREEAVYADLEAMLAAGNQAEADGDVETLQHLNSEFHELLSRGSGSSVLQSILATIRHQSRYLSGGLHSPQEVSWEEHSAIVSAVVSGYTREATTLMRRHLTDRHAAASTS
jgi:DNA-binding GntR family transcriptional regulator